METMKNIFTARDGALSDIGQVDYVPLIFIAGTVTHRLALHREIGALPNTMKSWRVSHPVVGASVITVYVTYRGMQCSSAGIGIKRARMHAMAALNALLERIGSDNFNSVIDTQVKRLAALAENV
jgi:hypothetical protein